MQLKQWTQVNLGRSVFVWNPVNQQFIWKIVKFNVCFVFLCFVFTLFPLYLQDLLHGKYVLCPSRHHWVGGLVSLETVPKYKIHWESRGQTGNSPALSTKKQLTNHLLILNANNMNTMFRDYSTRTQINRVFYNLAQHHSTIISYRSLKVLPYQTTTLHTVTLIQSRWFSTKL